ncbi:MAG: AgmX/PglI C-terminal domain-containing protein [Myxococcales bacterium]|nr:AgmX/PglI C-terminal domain-containing protein [Myxococcales bacterium]
MRKGKIALWVLVPFAALCALGYWLTSSESPAVPVEVASAAAAPAAAEPKARGPSTKTPVTDALTRALIDAREDAAPSKAAGGRPSVEKEEARAAVRAVEPMVRQCFFEVAGRYPGRQRVTLAFTIAGQGPNGSLEGGEVLESTVKDPTLEACFLEALADARFPAPQSGGRLRVDYPFSFEPDAGGPQFR